MIISISGKMGSGKDTVGNIIHYLLHNKQVRRNSKFHPEIDYSKGFSGFKTKKFADKLKDIACMLIGCTRDQLEDQEFKTRQLPAQWGKLNSTGEIIEFMTIREFLQKLGTEAMRDVIHENVWVNALMCDYKVTRYCDSCEQPFGDDYRCQHCQHPISDREDSSNWIITDTRFPNELEAVKRRGGITIRVTSPLRKGTRFKWKDFSGVISEDVVHSVSPNFKFGGGYCYYLESDNGATYVQSKDVFHDYHPSETALDDATFDYEIVNDGSIEELISKVEEILIKEKLL